MLEKIKNAFMCMKIFCLTWNSTATMCSVAEQGRMVALGWRRPASAVRQYQKNRECQGKRLVLKYGSPIRTETCKRDATVSVHCTAKNKEQQQ